MYMGLDGLCLSPGSFLESVCGVRWALFVSGTPLGNTGNPGIRRPFSVDRRNEIGGFQGLLVRSGAASDAFPEAPHSPRSLPGGLTQGQPSPRVEKTFDLSLF